MARFSERFAERYDRAYVLKDPDVEEPVDAGFHRRLAAVVTALLVDTDVTSNQVTIGSLAVGLWGSIFMYIGIFEPWFPEPLGLALAGLCLFGSVILDCADGQLARARGGGSLVGRILDGIVDTVVLCPAYVILCFGLREHFGPLWMWIGAYAGFSSWARIIIYDKIKETYLDRTVRTGSGDGSADETELETAQRGAEDGRLQGDRLQHFLMNFYAGYLKFQARLTGVDDFVDADGGEQEVSAPRNRADRAFYRREHLPTMRLASWMGLGSHMFLIYTGIVLGAVWIEALAGLQIVLSIAGTAVMVPVLWRFRKMV